ncbi:MAG: DUF58 domain-containing protein [Colwellia sp.]
MIASDKHQSSDRSAGRSSDRNIYTDIDELRRLQHLAKGFSFSPQQPINSVLSGKYVSKLRGRGLNFEELRHYQPGDDIRAMDWKVTQRTGKPHIKVYTEERERNVYLLIDQRATMFFGSSLTMKSVIAAKLSALIAWRMVDSGDRIGAVIYNDKNISIVPAKRGRQQVINVLKNIVNYNQQLQVGAVNNVEIDANQSLNKALAKLTHVCGNNALVILVGDGHGWNEQSVQHIKRIRQHNEVIACHVYDPLEQTLPQMSQMVVSDGKQQIQFSSSDKKIQQKYQSVIEEQLTRYAKTTRKYRIPLISINTVSPVEQQLREALGQVMK